jgi:hypothetical protein
MKKFSCLILLAASMSTTAWAACTYPAAPGKLPDGTTATREEMVAGKKLVEQYNTAMNTYLTCLKSEYEESLTKATSLSEEQKQQMAARYTAKNDAAVDELQGVASRFNEQLRVFKAKSTPAK